MTSPESSLSARQPLHALIVEDSPPDAELMVHEMRRSGFDLTWERVDTEADYLAHLEKSPEIVLADYALPQFSGLRALQLLQQQGLVIPFIVVSGTIGEEAAVDVMKQGATDYVLKSRLERLPASVRRTIQENRLREEYRQAQEELIRSHRDLERFADELRQAKNAMIWQSWPPGWGFGTGILSAMSRSGHTPAGRELLGLPLDSPASFQVLMNSVHPDDRERLQNAINAAIQEKRDYASEFRVVWPDGSVHWQEGKGHAFYDNRGHPTRMTGISWTLISAKRHRKVCACTLRFWKPRQIPS